MKFLQEILKLSGTGFTHGQYYESMNLALKRLNNEYTMLHYPFYVNESDSFIQAQKNLTDHCISLLNPLKNKETLEIGCGNGVQAIYICNKYCPLSMTGVDLNSANIRIANSESKRVNINNVRFHVDDAQALTHIHSDSADVMLNIESAFHYPDKTAFLKEVHRVLKPGGEFLIADILSTRIIWEKIMKTLGNRRVHHFWNRNLYEEEFIKSGLIINNREDITHKVSKGWSMYRSWLPKIKRKQFFRNVAFRLFYIINARLNIFYLNHGQQYLIFVGYKPVL
ncbi:MAG: class I SAM-dependent methyltransferase [Bacteroidales bacterium]